MTGISWYKHTRTSHTGVNFHSVTKQRHSLRHFIDFSMYASGNKQLIWCVAQRELHFISILFCRNQSDPAVCHLWAEKQSSSCVPEGYETHSFLDQHGQIRTILSITSCLCQNWPQRPLLETTSNPFSGVFNSPLATSPKTLTSV